MKAPDYTVWAALLSVMAVSTVGSIFYLMALCMRLQGCVEAMGQGIA